MLSPFFITCKLIYFFFLVPDVFGLPFISYLLVKAPSADKLTQFVSILSASMKQAVDGNVILSTNTEYTDFIKELSTDEFEYFKNILIGQELYEEVTNMINIRG